MKILVSVYCLYAGIWCITRMRWKPNPLAIFALCVFVISLLPYFLGNITGTLSFHDVAFGGRELQLTGVAQSFAARGSLLIIAIGVFITIGSLLHSKRFHFDIWSAGLGVIWLIAITHSQVKDRAFLTSAILLAILVLLSIVRTNHIYEKSDLGILIVSLTLLTSAISAALADNAFISCNGSGVKCLYTNQLFQGIFPHPNYLGGTLVLGAVIQCAESRNSKLFFRMLVIIFPVIIITLSRTSLIAALILIIISSKRVTRINPRPIFWIIGSCSILFLPILLYMLHVTIQPDFASYRGKLWLFSINHLSGSLAFGMGLDQWQQALVVKNQISVAGLYSPHNQLLTVLVTTGVIGAFLFLLFLVNTFSVSRDYGKALFVLAIWASFESFLTFDLNVWTWVIFALQMLRVNSVSHTPDREDNYDQNPFRGEVH